MTEWSAPAAQIRRSYGAELTARKEAVNWLGGRDDRLSLKAYPWWRRGNSVVNL